MGAVWDVTSAHERVLLYGSTFLFMLDIGHDVPSTMSRNKRERSSAGTSDGLAWKRRRKLESGAGSKASMVYDVGAVDVPKRSVDGEESMMPTATSEDGR